MLPLPHGSLVSWEPLARNRPVSLPLCASQDTFVMAEKCQALSHLTPDPLPNGPVELCLSFLSFSSSTSSVIKLQAGQQMWMTSEFSELGELSEICRFHQQPKPRLHLFLKPIRSRVLQMRTFMVFQR